MELLLIILIIFLIVASVFFALFVTFYTLCTFLFPKADIFFKLGLGFFLVIVLIVVIVHGKFFFPDPDFYLLLGGIAGCYIGALMNRKIISSVDKKVPVLQKQVILNSSVLFFKLILYALAGMSVSFLIKWIIQILFSIA